MLLINGQIAGEQGGRRADLRVEGEHIAEIRETLAPREGERVIDCAGKIILPGGVDVHTHMDLDLGDLRASDDFYTGTVAAACGGTTTIVDHMAFGPKGCSIRHQVEVYHRLAEGKAVIDYGFHGVADHVDDAILAELPGLIRDGVTSHKIYMTYAGKISDSEALRLLERTRELGMMVCVHAENDGFIAHLREKYRAQGESAAIYHARSRPALCEAEAAFRIAVAARLAGDAPLYLVHTSAAPTLKALSALQQAGQQNLFIETCPQYLFLEDGRYLAPDGLKYILSPPLRKSEDREALWSALQSGKVDTVATDHCPFFYIGQKQRGKDDFSKTPGGVGGVELRMPLLFSEVMDGNLSLGRMVSLCCASPARLFGLYPQKGVIAPGSDADLVVMDPDLRPTVSIEMLHEHSDYSVYEGMKLRGYPVMTLSRGEVIAENGQFTGKKGRGRYLRRGLPILSRE